MDIFLSKLAPVFVFPLGAAIAALILVFVASVLGYRNVSLAILGMTIVGLWVASAPAVSVLFSWSLERQYPPRAPDDIPHADVVIVLGGFALPPIPPSKTLELSDAVDRAIYGAELYRAGKVDFVLASGGNLPWQSSGQPEAVLIAEFIVQLGVPREAIVLETTSRKTRENAPNSAAVLNARGWKTALLVTSATHMPRAISVFRRAGIDAVPCSTDARVRSQGYSSILDLLPDAGALGRTTEAIKEWMGLIAYRMRGWA